MEKIRNIEKITNRYPNWKPADIAFIKSLQWFDDTLEMVFYCHAESPEPIFPDLTKKFFSITITFFHVSALHLSFSDSISGLYQLMGFDIIDVSSRGLEKIHFAIEDYEEQRIAFYCHSIEVQSVLEEFDLKLYSSSKE